MILILIIPVTLIIIGLVLKNKQDKKLKAEHDEKYLIDTSIEKVNDKLVIVKASHTEVSVALTEFIKSYNEGSLTVCLRLHVISENTFAITFPYDIAFEFFCYFVNFMRYPIGLENKLEPLGWTTTPLNDNFIKEGYENTFCMFFVPDDDDEYDNVFMTTKSDKGLKISFNLSNGSQPLEAPKKIFEKPHFSINELSKYPSKDLK